jgi:hypothetical protein
MDVFCNDCYKTFDNAPPSTTEQPQDFSSDFLMPLNLLNLNHTARGQFS